jgi:hypothetical protein
MSSLTKEVAFEAFIKDAIDYRQAADALLRFEQTESMLLSPIYNSYFIATELALKAFLRYSGQATELLKSKWKHNLIGMLSEAISCGLKIDQADLLDISNIINLLHDGNKQQAFRYFIWESRCLPDVAWAGKVVRILIDLVRRQTGYDPNVPGPAVKFDIVIGQPQPR